MTGEKETGQVVKINAMGIYHKELNRQIRGLANDGVSKVELHNVYGQRYIGTSLKKHLEIEIYGTPGNDLGAFMDGPKITVHGNAQDGCGNTMNNGEVIVHGHAGDIIGLSARGGKIFVRDDVGYRAGIHMKEYLEQKPKLVVGGTAQDFAGEYMAGGIMVLLGCHGTKEQKANFIGTGMHGGVIYLRGTVESHQVGREVGTAELEEADWQILRELVSEFTVHFGGNTEELLNHQFSKLFPLWLRPYGKIYAY
ncbi:hypothetical protein ACFLU1_06920 [Chloroflexota bacterium]